MDYRVLKSSLNHSATSFLISIVFASSPIWGAMVLLKNLNLPSVAKLSHSPFVLWSSYEDLLATVSGLSRAINRRAVGTGWAAPSG